MMKEEFEGLIGREVSSKEYSEIEFVYTWHPAISETEGKKQIAMLYETFGMTVIRNMTETAAIMQDLDKERREAVRVLEQINKRIGLVHKGNLVHEKCRKECDVLFEKSADQKEWSRVKSYLEEKYGKYTVDEVVEELGV